MTQLTIDSKVDLSTLAITLVSKIKTKEVSTTIARKEDKNISKKMIKRILTCDSNDY